MQETVRRLGSRALLIAIGLLLGLGVGEILVRAFGPELPVVFRDSIVASDDQAQGYTLRPGSADRGQRISSAGLRDREYVRPKPPGVVRIAAVGDSITFAFGVRADRGWAKQLEALLAAGAAPDGPRFEVLNLGVPGYNVAQIAARLRGVGLSFEPDAVIYGYSLNDPQDVSIEAEALRTLRDAFERSASEGAGRWLVHSRLYLLARKIAFERVKTDALRAQPPTDPAFEAAKRGAHDDYFRALHSESAPAERLRSGLDELAAITRGAGLPVLMVLFPLFGAGSEALADLHATVAEAARQRGFAVLDLLPVYGAATRSLGADLSLDFMHPDRLGHRVAAVAMLDWMCRTAWPPIRSLDCARAEPRDATDATIARIIDASVAPNPPP